MEWPATGTLTLKVHRVRGRGRIHLHNLQGKASEYEIGFVNIISCELHLIANSVAAIYKKKHLAKPIGQADAFPCNMSLPR